MKKRPSKQQKANEQDLFQAYGEYSYAYLHQEDDQPPQKTKPGEPKPKAPTVAMVKRARQKHKTGLFFKMLGVLAALTVLIIVLQETVFRLQTVYVIGNQTHTPQQVVMTSGLVKGRNIFTITEAEVLKNMAQDHTLIFKGMQIEYPNTVYLYVEERKAVSVMRWLGNQYELDASGLVMNESGTMDLPVGMPLVTGFRVTSIHTGRQISVRSHEQMQAYCDIMSELTLQLYADQVAEVNLSDTDNIYLITSEGVTVRMGSGAYMRAKIGAIRTYMAYLRQLGKTSGVLDVSIPEDAKFMPED